MPHAIESRHPTLPGRTSKTKAASSRELQRLHLLYNSARNHFLESNTYLSIIHFLESKNRLAVTKILSLGLGSLKSVDQSRRIKQLVILLAIAETLRQYEPNIEIHAQDPSFSKTDEAFLQSLGIVILRTHSPADLGEAAQHIDGSSLVFCPFLTLEAYQLLFSTKKINFFIGDDFDALRVKWPKHSPERSETDSLSKQFLQDFRKRVIGGDGGFWNKEDKPFPMAMYRNILYRDQGKQLPAKL